MVTYQEKDLVAFGNELLRKYGVMVYSTDGKNTPLYQRSVTHADFANWTTDYPMEQGQLPSNMQIGDKCKVSFNNEELNAEVITVHFTKSKVKYDLDITLSDNTNTRIYNIDSAFITTI